MTRAFTILFVLIILLGLCCEKETYKDDPDGYPLELTAELVNDQVVLNWVKVGSQGFDGYTVLRSTDSIPDQITIDQYSNVSEQMLSDSESTTWLDTDYPLREKLYYKVIAQLDDRLLLSPTVEVALDLTILDQRLSSWAVFPNEGILVLWDDQDTYSLNSYDYKQKKVLSSSGSIGNHVSFYPYQSPSGEPSLYVEGSWGPQFISTLNPRTFEEMERHEDFINNIKRMAVDQDFIYLCTSNQNSAIEIRRKSDFALMAQYDIGISFYDRNIAVLNDQRQVVSASEATLFLLQFNDEAGMTVQDLILFNPRPDLLPNIVVHPNQEYFIPYKNGDIYDKTLEVMGTLGGSNATFSEIRFKEDGTKVYAIKNETVEVYDFPTLTRERTIPIDYTPKAIFDAFGEIMVVGEINIDAKQKTIIQTFQL